MGLTADNDTFQLVMYGIELGFIWIIITPLIIYHSIRYYKLRNEPEISKRYTNLVIGMSISCLIYVTFGRSIALVKRAKIPLDETGEILNIIFYIVGSFSLLNILFWRIFMLNFEIRYNMMIAKGSWMKYINFKSTEQINWYYTHRSTIGNLKWMMYRIFIPIWLIQLIILLFTSRLFGFADNIIYYGFILLLSLIIIIAIMIEYCRTPKYADIFRLRDESSFILKIGLIGFISFLVVAVIDTADLLQSEAEFFCIMLNEIILDGTFFGMVMISTHWVLKNSLHKTLIDNYEKMQMLTSNNNGESHIKLTLFLSKKEGVYAFMSHLCREFSSENLLFLYEAILFREFCQEAANIGIQMQHNENNKANDYDIMAPESPHSVDPEEDDEKIEDRMDIVYNEDEQKQDKQQQNTGDVIRKFTKTNDNEMVTIKLPKDLPRSDIVYAKNKSIRNKFKLLSDKYIFRSSPFQLNLPYLIQEAIISNYEDRKSLSNEELCTVFDDAIQVVLKLMDASYSRFCYTESYMNVVNTMNI